jgi:hypothetical protein
LFRLQSNRIKDAATLAPGAFWFDRPARPTRVLSNRNREEFSLTVQIHVGHMRNDLAGAPGS